MLPYLSETKVVTVGEIYALANNAISKECEEDIITYMTNYRVKHKLVELTELGFDIEVSEEDSAKGLRGYEQWVVLNKEDFDNHKAEVPVVKITVPKSKYLMLTITDPFIDPWERIPNAWKKIWAEVEEKHTFRKDFTTYGYEEKIDTIHGTYMNIYVPII